MRAILAMFAGALGYFAVTAALASYFIRSDANAEAYQLASWNGEVAARFARSLAMPDSLGEKPVVQTKAEEIARRALMRDPTAVDAAIALGLNAQVSGHVEAARKLFGYAEVLSRRELQTQLWAIEDAVARNDIPGVLRQYDIALRTSGSVRQLLFPVLASAISDPQIRSALTATLMRRPEWADAFIHFVATNGPDPAATLKLFSELRHAGFPDIDSAGSALIDVLIAHGYLQEAWAYYVSIHPGTDRSRSRDSHFVAAADSERHSALDWVSMNGNGVSTSIERGDNGAVLDFSVPASVGGVLAKQMQILSPGEYLIEGHSAQLDDVAASRPYWVLSCRDGRELGRVILPNSKDDSGAFSGVFRVTSDCPVQMLSLVARPSNKVSGLSGQILDVKLYPSR